MKRKEFKKLTPAQRAALQELARSQPATINGITKAENKGFSDLPLFGSIQTKLF